MNLARCILPLLVLLLSCGREKEKVTTVTHSELEQRYEQKLEEFRLASLDHVAGWPSDEDCDGALWAGIARAAGATWVDISAALQPDGRPTRRPYRDCSFPDESKATTSNDMITGIILGLQAVGDLDSAILLYQYGENNSWVMGYPPEMISRVILRPNGITLLSRVIYQLSDGSRDYAVRLLPMLYGPTAGDYQDHLTLLSRLASQRSGQSSDIIEVVESAIATANPLDALAQAVAGNLTQAALLLLNKEYKAPSYVRGHHNYELVHWLLAARVTLDKSSLP